MTELNKNNLFKYVSKLLNSKVLLIFLLLLTIIATFFYYPSNVGDYDIWWHFALGKHYIDNMTVIVDHSIFSWTKADPKWIYNTWLGSTLMYIAYKFGGGFGLWLIQWLILLFLLLIAYRFMITLKERFDVNYLLLFFATIVGLNLTAIYVKPELFTTLLFGITLLIYLYGKYTFNHKVFYLYPPLMILWCNLHGGFLSGLMFITIAFITEAISFLLMPNKTISLKMLITLGIALPLSYIATVINPYGIDYHLSIYNSLTNDLYTKYSSMVFAYLKLWDFIIYKGADTPFRFLSTAWVMLAMFIFQTTIIIYQFIKNKYLDLSLAALIVFFFIFGMFSARYSIFFIVLSLFTIPYLSYRGGKLDAVSIKVFLSALSVILIVCLSTFILWMSIFYVTGKEYFGSAFDEKKYLPYETSEFLLKSGIKEQIFNDYLIGGYLMWSIYPTYKVFIDPRYGPFWQEVGPDYFELINHFSIDNFKKFNDKYKFKIAVLHMRETVLIFSLLQSGDWRLLYLDITSVVLIHKSLIPKLSPDVLSTDVSPKRFRHVDNPDALAILFNFYIHAGPQFGYEILNIYENNVSKLFKYRDLHIMQMKTSIIQKENQIRMNQK